MILRELLPPDRHDDTPAETQIELATVLRPLILLQEFPDLALIATSGIVVPPHERTMLYQLHCGASSNVIVASRGTAKSSTVCVLYANYKALVFPRRSIIELSSTGFRGGQMLFLDVDRWVRGGWDSQEPDVQFYRGSIPRPQILNRSQNFWSIEYDSFSKIVTLPTKDPDAIRGHRGNDLIVDEANFFDKEIIDKVALPFLNVKSDFRHGGMYSVGNQVYYVSTIDFNWRAFQERVTAAREGLQRDMWAIEAANKGDWERHDELERQGLCEHTFTKFDYTDLLIRRHVTNRIGQAFEVWWPNPDIALTVDKRGIPFHERAPDGAMLKQGSTIEYYQTYPVDKHGLERPLMDGSSDEAGWLSEQRNVVDSAVGDVYSSDIVDKAACVGSRCIIPYESLPPAWQTKYKDEPRDYVAPVLWRCTDSCVLGVDYAPVSDFCAFVVIRLGPLAKGEFDPFTHLGKTEWSNVIWAEQHLRMSHKEAADKVRELSERYNLVYFFDPHVNDSWEMCRAIGLDMRGGGSGVRDQLCFIDEETVPVGKYRIYDPLDKDERIQAFARDMTAKPMLDSIMPTDQLNDRLVEYTVGQLQAGLLYIGKYLDISQRPRSQRELYIAFDALKSLDGQLRKLRQAPTKHYRTFKIEGDTEKVQNKKDLWSGFIYAAKQMRAHVIRQRQIDNTPPPMGGLVTKIGSGRGRYSRVPGARD